MPSTPMLVQQLPWSSAEVQALKELGVELRDPVKQLSALAMQWLRPLLAARKRFVMVLPPPGREVHPVRQLLQQLIPDFEAQALDLDAACGSQLVGSLTEQVASLPFPEVQRHIQLPGPLKLSTNSQSYTALNELFNAPALFALKRIARLNPTSILAVEEDNRLLGILAHRVFEKLFAHADVLTWTNQQAKAGSELRPMSFSRTEGAVLLMQGAGISLQRFQMTCEGAICSLLDHLREAKAVRVQTEAEFDGVLGPVPLTGKIDLLVELPDNKVVALDMKWRGDNHYARTLREGGHLQLALYSSLVEQQTGTAPAALGFFILESGALFISHPGYFPKAQLTPPPEGVTVGTLLDRAKATWSWRTDQFAAGQIEVVPHGPADDYKQRSRGHAAGEGAQPMGPGLPCIAGRVGVMNNIEFVSAGAGSGKTYKLTETLAQALESGAARPHAILATTFTVKAATELRERARSWLLEKGRVDLATAIGQARLGTVNSVCGQMLKQFCFELGLSPDQTVLSEGQTKRLLETSLAETLDPVGQSDFVQLTRKFGIEQEDWAKTVKDVVKAALDNDIAPAALRTMGPRNADQMLANWPAPTAGGDPTAVLSAAVVTACQE